MNLAAFWIKYMNEMKKYAIQMNASDDEKEALYEWCNEGNDFKKNPYNAMKDNNELDFIAAIRTIN